MTLASASPLMQQVGWLLVHSVWEFAAIALVLAIVLRALRGASAGTRYVLALVGWGAMLVAPAATWCVLPEVEPPTAAVTAAPGATPIVAPVTNAAPPANLPTPAEAFEQYWTGAAASIAAPLAPSARRTPAAAWTESLRVLIAPWLNTLVVIWCLGVSAFAARSARGWYVVRRLLHRDVTSVPPELAALLNRVAAQIGLRGPVRLLQSSRVDVPLVIGWLRPVVLLPVCVATGFSPQQLEAILAHELAHIRRHDYLINLLQNLSETVFFYHPALWWVSAVLRREREHCCDELAARALGDRAEYGRALLALEELRGAAPTLALGAKGGSLLERIRRLAQLEPTPRLGAGGVIGIALVAAVIVGATVWGAGATQKASGREAEQKVVSGNGGATHIEPNSETAAGETPTTTYKGTVVDPHGQPLADAHVRVYETFTWTEHFLAETRTDKNGRFEITGIPQEAEGRWFCKLIVSSPAFATRVMTPATIGESEISLEISLPEPSTVRGRVVDPQGEPVANADVFGPMLKEPVPGAHSAKTDANGYFQITDLEPWDGIGAVATGRQTPGQRSQLSSHNSLSLRIQHPDYGRALENYRSVPSKHIIQLQVPIVVSGRVRNSRTRAPLADILVAAGNSSTTTDAAGKYRLPIQPRENTPLEVKTFQLGWSEASAPVQAARGESVEVADLLIEARENASTTAAASADASGVAPKPNSGGAKTDERIPINIIQAKNVLLLDGKQIVTWKEIDEKIAALPDPKRASVHLYVTSGASAAGLWDSAQNEVNKLNRKYNFSGYGVGSIGLHANYDRVKTAADLVPDALLRREGIVMSQDGKPVAGAEVVLITPVDDSLSYKAYDIYVVSGRVRNPLDEVLTKTDKSGRFAIYPPKGAPFRVLALHPDKGIALVDNDQFDKDAQLKLLPWGGVVAEFSKEPEEQEASLRTHLEARDGRPEINITQYWVDLKRPEPTLKFEFTHVPPIWQTSISRDFRQTHGSRGIGGPSVSLLPGETQTITLGPVTKQQRELMKSLDSLLKPRAAAGAESAKGVAQANSSESPLTARSDADLNARAVHDLGILTRITDPRRIPLAKDQFEIGLNGARFTDDDLAQLTGFSKLKHLSLIATNIHGDGLKHLTALPQLEQLTLAGAAVTDRWLEQLPPLPNLKSLTLRSGRITDRGLLLLQRYPKLEQLHIGDMEVGDVGLAVLQHVPNLKRLALKHTLVSDAGLEQLAHVPHLQYFSLASPNVTGTGLARVATMQELNELQFVGPSVTDEWLRAVEPLRNVTWLELHGTSITSKGLAAISQWTKLRRAYLNNNPLTDEAVQHLKEMYLLNSVELHQTRFTAKGAKQLREALPDTSVGVDEDLNPQAAIGGQESLTAAAGGNESTRNGGSAVDVETVDVLCVDADSHPVAGAEVYVFQHDGPLPGRYVQSGPFTTDAEGHVAGAKPIVRDDAGHFDRFYYARVPGKLVGVGRSINWKGSSVRNPEGRIEMRPSQSVSGHVSALPVADLTKVTVRVQVMHVVTGSESFDHGSWPREDSFAGIDTGLPEIFERRPAADGTFEFTDVPVRGRLYVLTHGGGFGEAQWANYQTNAFDKPIELLLSPEGQLAGRVLGPAGEPAEGIEVSARRNDGAYSSTARATTNEQGEYKIGGLAATRFNVSASDPQNRWVMQPLESVAILSGKTQLLPLKLETPVVIRGRAVDESGAPVAAASVSAVNGAQNPLELNYGSTDDEGRYSLRVPSGGVQLYFNGLPEGFVYPDPQMFQKLDVKPGQAAIDVGDVVLKRKEQVAAKVSVSATSNESLQASSASVSESKADASAKPSVPMTTLTGTVVDEQGRPATGVSIEARYFRGTAVAVTDAQARFRVTLPENRVQAVSVVAISADGAQQGIKDLSWAIDPTSPPEVAITLKPAITARVRVIDRDAQPVAGANVAFRLNYYCTFSAMTDERGEALVALPTDGERNSVHAWKRGSGLDYKSFIDPRRQREKQPQVAPDLSLSITLVLSGARPLTVRLRDADSDAPIRQAETYVWYVQKAGEPDHLGVEDLVEVTNDRGEAKFDWLPEWQSLELLQVWPHAEDYDHQRGTFQRGESIGPLTMRLHKLVPISGRVVFPDGRPAPGIKLDVSGEGYSFDSFRQSTTTDADGRYEIKVSPNQVYLMIVQDQKWAAQPATGFAMLPGKPKQNVDFHLQPATRIFGRVTMGNDRQPVPGQRITSYQYGGDLNNMKDSGITPPNDDRKWVQPMCFHHAVTDADGRFEFFVGPGNFDIRGPTQNKVPKFEITTEAEREFDFHMERPGERPLTGLVISGDQSVPVAKARIQGIYRQELAGGDINTTTDSNGQFKITRELHRTVLYADSEDRTLAGVVEIGPDEASVIIKLQPCAVATGRFIDSETKQPVADAELQYGVDVHIGDDNAPWRVSFGGSVRTNENGAFSLPRLVIGQHYRLTVVSDRDSEGGARSWSRITDFTPTTAGEQIDLGDVLRKPPPAPYEAPTLQERTITAFRKPDSAAKRYQNNLRDVRIGHLRQLMIFGDPDAEPTLQFFKLRYDDENVRAATDNYWLLPLPLSGDKSDDTRAFVQSLGIEVSEGSAPVFVVIDEAEQRLATVEAKDLSSDGAIDKQKVLDFLAAHAPEQLDAQVLFDDALAQAKTENKRVFIQESATWCGPCWMLSRFIAAHRDVLEQDYIFVKLDHRWPHSQEIAKKFQKEPGGIPWCAIMDADQQVLATSDGPDGNIGYPAKDEPQGIEHFVKMLRDSRIRLTDADLDGLRAALEGKETPKTEPPTKQKAEAPAEPSKAKPEPTAQTETKPPANPDQDPDGGSKLLREIRAKSAPLLAALAEKHGYGLKEGEDVKLVPPPFNPARMEYYRIGQPGQAEAIPRGPTAMLFHWREDSLTNWSMQFGDTDDPGQSIAGLCEWILDRKPQDIDGASELLQQRIPGDWVVRLDTSEESRMRQLNTILLRDAPIAVRLNYKMVKRPVYVARGTYKLTPLPGHDAEDRTQLTDGVRVSDKLYIFGAETPNADSGAGGGCGDFREFLSWLGRWIEAPVISEVDTGPTRGLCWSLHEASPFTQEQHRLDHDPARVLANITKQTGLKFDKAERDVRILFVEHVERK